MAEMEKARARSWVLTIVVRGVVRGANCIVREVRRSGNAKKDAWMIEDSRVRKTLFGESEGGRWGRQSEPLI